MSFGNVANRLYFKTVDTSENPVLGTFTLSADMQLNYGRVLLFKNGLTITNQRFRLNLTSINDSSVMIATSEWFNLSDIPNPSTYWIGFVRFAFAGQFLDSNSAYIMRLEPSNYTRVGDTDYIGLSMDWPNPINTSTVPTNPPIGVELYGTI